MLIPSAAQAHTRHIAAGAISQKRFFVFSKAAGIPAKPASAPNTASMHIITRQVNSRCVSLRYSVRYIPALSATSPPASTAALTDAGFVSRIFIEVRLFSSSFISSASSSCFESLSASVSSLPFSSSRRSPSLSSSPMLYQRFASCVWSSASPFFNISSADVS